MAATSSPFRWAVLVPVGPNEIDADRFDDLVASLVRYEPSAGPVFILNDGGDPRRLQAALERHSLQGSIWPNPRAGLGNAWLGRLTSGLAHSYQRIHDQLPDHHVLKLDTDALIIRPFADRLAQLLSKHPQAGMVGSVELTPDGVTTGSWFTQRVYRMGKRISRWDHKPYFRTSFFGARARMRRLLRAAYACGYVPGYAPCGGAYFLTAEAIRRMNGLAAMHDQELIADNTLTEDIFFSIVVHASGLKVLEQNDEDDVFGVCWRGLPARSLARVVERGHAIIHSVKDHESFTESATRAFFRALRAAP